MDAVGYTLTSIRGRIAHSKPAHISVALALVPLCFLTLFYIWPVLTLLARVIDAEAVRETLTRPGLGRIIGFTFLQALISTLATLILGIGPAYLLARWDFKGRRYLSALITIPFMLPTVVVSSAFIALLPHELHNTVIAIVIVHVFFNITVVARIVGTLWSHIPRNLTGAARTLGANKFQTLRHITLVLLSPAIMAASAIIFLFTFTSFGVIQIMGGPSNPTLEVEIARRAISLGDTGGAAVLAVMQLILLVALIALSARTARATTHELNAHNVVRLHPRTRRQNIVVYLSALLLAAIVLTPLLVLVRSSFRVGGQWSTYAWTHLRATATRPGLIGGVDPLAAMGTSFRYVIVATFISLFVGTLTALAISSARHKGKFIDVGFMLPLGTSAVTIGFGMLITFSRAPFDWRNSWWLVPVGHSLIAIPFVVRTILPILRSRPQGWLDAAATLGASPWRVLKEIDIARLWRPMRVAGGIAAAISLGEFGATTFLTRSDSESMPLAIARLLARTGDIQRAQAFMLATILAVITSLIIFAIEVRNA